MTASLVSILTGVPHWVIVGLLLGIGGVAVSYVIARIIAKIIYFADMAEACRNQPGDEIANDNGPGVSKSSIHHGSGITR